MRVRGFAGATCADPLEGIGFWADSAGRTCADYARGRFCTPDGDHGPGWDVRWGDFGDVSDRLGDKKGRR